MLVIKLHSTSYCLESSKVRCYLLDPVHRVHMYIMYRAVFPFMETIVSVVTI